MPSPFDPVAAYLQLGGTVRGTVLAFFDFKDAPMRVHPGSGRLRAGGEIWQGVGQLGSVSDIETAVGATAPLTTFVLSGTDPVILQDVVEAKERVKGRRCTVGFQFFDNFTLAPVGPLVTVFRGRMDRLIHVGQDATTWTAKLTAEGLFTRRALPPCGNLSDRDQQRLYPGDTGLTQVPALQNRTRPWNPNKE